MDPTDNLISEEFEFPEQDNKFLSLEQAVEYAVQSLNIQFKEIKE